MMVNLGKELLKECYQNELLVVLNKLNVEKNSIDLVTRNDEFFSYTLLVNSKVQLYVVISCFSKVKYPISVDVLLKATETEKWTRLKHKGIGYSENLEQLIKEIVDALEHIYHVYVS